MMTDDTPEHQTQAAMQARIDALEIRLAFLDELVDSLNSVVASQDRHLHEMQHKMRVLYQRMSANHSATEGIEPFDAHVDVPPHY
jgi:SlyX protein